MRRVFLFLFCLTTSLASAQEVKVDSIAIRLIDKMSAVIGEMSSLRFQLETSNDHLNDLHENERYFSNHEIFMTGPNKMAVHTDGDRGNKAIWYNGTYFNYYSFDENNYVTLKAPGTILNMIDSMNSTFGVDFPAADLFYPTLAADLVDNFDQVRFLGRKEVDGQDCFFVMATSETMTFQLWISNSMMFLPKRFLIIDKANGYQQHQGTFKEWEINPTLPENIFEFVPPKSAKLISILSKS
ncbi:MAG: DUF2092 domain-containing protein [Bacteroidota bacterium]